MMDVFSVCRLCGSNRKNFTWKLSEHSERNESLLNKLAFCISVEVSPNDGLPQVVCSQCENTLELCHSFIHQCLNTDKWLRDTFQEEYVPAPAVLWLDSKGGLKEEVKEEPEIEEIEVLWPGNDSPPATRNFNTNTTADSLSFVKHRNSSRRIAAQQSYVVPPNNNTITDTVVRTATAGHTECQVKDDGPSSCISSNVMDKTESAGPTAAETNDDSPGSLKLKMSNVAETSPVSNARGTGKETTAKTSKTRALPSEFDLQIPCTDENVTLENSSSTANEMWTFKDNFYMCNVCDKKRSYKCDIIEHCRIHSGERPFACNVCYAAFKHKYYLKVHMRSHTGERPYECSRCRAAFHQLSHLKDHVLIHRGESPYKCDVCQKPFRRASNLKRHKFIHRNIKKIAESQ